MIEALYAIYGLVLCMEGAAGYVRTKSLPAVYAGNVSGGAIAVAVVMLQLGYTKPALALGFVVSFVFGMRFGDRYRATKKFMPAAPICILSVAVMVFSWSSLFHK